MSSSRPTPGGLADFGLAAPAPVSVCCEGDSEGAIGAIGRIGATGVVTISEGIGLTEGIALIIGSWTAIAAEQA
jgi:hypothetical protein